MKYANKFSLVPFTQQIENPAIKHLSDLDSEIKNIVYSKRKPDQKVKLYNKAFGEMMTNIPSREEPKEEPIEMPKEEGKDVKSAEIKNTLNKIMAEIKKKPKKRKEKAIKTVIEDINTKKVLKKKAKELVEDEIDRIKEEKEKQKKIEKFNKIKKEKKKQREVKFNLSRSIEGAFRKNLLPDIQNITQDISSNDLNLNLDESRYSDVAQTPFKTAAKAWTSNKTFIA